MISAAKLSEKFSLALPYARYVATGTDEQQRRWKQVYDVCQITGPQRSLLSGFVRQMNVLVISGIWCGDCVQQCPLIQRIAEGKPGRIDVRLVDRDQHRDLIEPLRINGGDRVPVAIFMAEDFEPCAVFGDRTLHRYRAIALKQLGAACPTGIMGPDKDEMALTLGDWLDEFERVQLMLRTSARLRQKHGD
jgi:thiol-disulfide isomerase/thioredoxin